MKQRQPVGQEVDEAELEARRAQLQARKAQDALDPQSAAADPATVSCEGRKGGAKRGAKREEDQTLREDFYYYYYSIENEGRRLQTPPLSLVDMPEVQACTSSSEPLIGSGIIALQKSRPYSKQNTTLGLLT